MVTTKRIISFTIDQDLFDYWKRISKKENLNLSGIVNKFLKKEKEKMVKKEDSKK